MAHIHDPVYYSVEIGTTRIDPFGIFHTNNLFLDELGWYMFAFLLCLSFTKKAGLLWCLSLILVDYKYL